MNYFDRLILELSNRAKNVLATNMLNTQKEFFEFVFIQKDFNKLKNIGQKTNEELCKMTNHLISYYNDTNYDDKTNENSFSSFETFENNYLLNVNEIDLYENLKNALKYFDNVAIHLDNKNDINNERATKIYLDHLERFIESEYTYNNKLLIDRLQDEKYTTTELKKINANQFRLLSKLGRSLRYIQIDVGYVITIINSAPHTITYYKQLINALGYFLVYTDNYVYFKKENAKFITTLIAHLKTKNQNPFDISDSIIHTEIYLIEVLNYFNCSIKNNKIIKNTGKVPLELVYDYLILRGQSQKFNDIINHLEFNQKTSDYLFLKLRRDSRFQKIGKTGLISLKEWNAGELSSLLIGTALEITINVLNYYRINKISFRTIQNLLRSVGWLTDSKTYYSNIHQTSKNEFRISNQIIYSSLNYYLNFIHIFNRCNEIIKEFESGNFKKLSQHVQYLLIIELENFGDSEIINIYKIKSNLRQIGLNFKEQISTLARSLLERENFEIVFQIKLSSELENLFKGEKNENPLQIVKSILENKYIDYSEHQLILKFINEKPEQQEEIIKLISSSLMSKLIDHSKQIEVILNSNHSRTNEDSVQHELQYLFFNTIDNNNMLIFMKTLKDVLQMSNDLIQKKIRYLDSSFDINIIKSTYSGLLIDFDHQRSTGILTIKSKNFDDIVQMICHGILGLLLNRNLINPIEIHSHYSKIEKFVKGLNIIH